MDRFVRQVVAQPVLARILIVVLAALAGLAAVDATRRTLEHDRRDWLRNETSRRAIELMGQTLNGKVMGSMSVLGLVDPGIKTAAQADAADKAAFVAPMIETVGRSYGANGVFIVGSAGRITASWDIQGRSNTGLDVKFRSYFQMAMRGKENVYAAVSIATGERVLYFSAPVHADATNRSVAIGAAVARIDLSGVNGILDAWDAPAVLLTPQGVVFATNREPWLYRLAGEATAERVKKIRELKQFGTRFEKQAPEALPIAVDDSVSVVDGRHLAVAAVPVKWNDPVGDWTLVLTTELDQAMPLRQRLIVGGGAGAVALLLLSLGLNLLRSRYQREQAMRELQASAERAEARAQQRQRLAAISLRLQQADNLHDLAHTFLIETVDLLDMRQGAFYRVAADGEGLERIACYGCRDGEGTPLRLEFGVGLLGQCALDRRLQILTDPPQGYWHIASGLGEAVPRAVVLAPVLLNDAVLGVVELGLLTPPDEARREIIAELLPLLAMTLAILLRQRGAADARDGDGDAATAVRADLAQEPT